MNKNPLSISDDFQHALLAEANNACANPDCCSPLNLSNAHYNIVFQPNIQHVDNFLALCDKCARKQLDGTIQQAAIQAWKILRLAISGEIQTRQMDMKLGAIRNYRGLQPFFPDDYLAFPFGGGQIYLNVKESQMMLARALGVYEPDKTQTICDLLKPGQTFIDVGGNKGDFSLLAAKITGDKGRVLTFEPEPENCHWFEKSIKLNNYDSIQLFNLALSDSNGTAQLYLGEKSGWHSLISAQGNTNNSTIEVEKRSLDSVLDKNNIHQVDMMKIDVEGAEMEVLTGAEQVLNDNPDLILLLDLHPHMGVNVVSVCDYLLDKGFSIYSMKSPCDKLSEINQTTTEILARR